MAKFDAFSKVKVWDPENDYSMCLYIKNGAKCIINSGNFLSGYEPIYVYEGECIINDGFVFAQHDPSRTNKIFELNCYDANYKNGTAKIICFGGKYADFNPAANASESSTETTNFVAKGYKSVLDSEYTYTHKFHLKKTRISKFPAAYKNIINAAIEQMGTPYTPEGSTDVYLVEEDTDWTKYDSYLVTETLTVPVYAVVPMDDQREGTPGTVEWEGYEEPVEEPTEEPVVDPVVEP